MSETTALAILGSTKAGVLYERMEHAISECYSVDDCASIADQASAIAAYFKQIKDDESVRKFLTVKLRAWRQIGLILASVDAAGCETQTAHIQKIMEAFWDNPTVVGMSPHAVMSAVKLARLPGDFFEREVGRHSGVTSMLAAYQQHVDAEWAASPAGQAELAARKRHQAEVDARYAERQRKELARQAKEQEREAEQREADAADLAALRAAQAEVGFTMDRRDRREMRQVVFLIKDTVHEVLRQAAFDQRTTMQAILRAGLAMWLVGHGYSVDMGEMDLPPKR